MGKISTYDNASPISLDDKVIGTSVDGSPVNATKNFLVSDLLTLIQATATKHVEDFLIADFVGSVYTLTAATHGRGTNPVVQTYDATTRIISYGGDDSLFATTTVVEPLGTWDAVAGPNKTIKLDAVFPGVNGNDITIVGTGTSYISFLVSNWNAANPTNTVSFQEINASGFKPANGYTFNLSGGGSFIDNVKIEANGDIKVTAGEGGAFDGTIIVM
jgi:hypothetical protein